MPLVDYMNEFDSGYSFLSSTNNYNFVYIITRAHISLSNF